MNTIQEEDSYKQQGDQTIISLHTDLEDEALSREYFPALGKGSLLSLQSTSTIKQDFQKTSIRDSISDGQSQKCSYKVGITFQYYVIK